MKKRQGKRALVLLLVGFMILSLMPLNTLANTQVKGADQLVRFVIGHQSYSTGGVMVETDVAPYIKDNRTMVPVAFVAPALGSDRAIWNPYNRTVSIERGDDLIMITIGSNKLLVNGEVLEMDTTAEIKDIGGGGGRTMLPIAFVARALGVGHQWDNITRSVDFYGYAEDYVTPGTSSDQETIYGNVTISAANVHLQNKTIKGNLIIAESVGKGDVFLDNVTVEGNTYVRGGGKDSIHINGGSYTNVIIENTPEGGTRVVATNTQGINIVIATAEAGESVVLEGPFATVTITAANAVINTQGETTIQNLMVNDTATVTITAETTVQNVTVNAEATLTGAGTIVNVRVNANDVVISTTSQPAVTTAAGITATTSIDATLRTTSTVKGEQVAALGTANVDISEIVAGNITITAVKAADTSNATTFITLFDPTHAGATVKVVKYADGAVTTGFGTDPAYNNEAIINQDFFIIRVVAEDGTSTLYYKVVVTITG